MEIRKKGDAETIAELRSQVDTLTADLQAVRRALGVGEEADLVARAWALAKDAALGSSVRRAGEEMATLRREWERSIYGEAPRGPLVYGRPGIPRIESCGEDAAIAQLGEELADKIAGTFRETVDSRGPAVDRAFGHPGYSVGKDAP